MVSPNSGLESNEEEEEEGVAGAMGSQVMPLCQSLLLFITLEPRVE